MLYLSIELTYYKRMRLNCNKFFRLEMHNRIQMILGTNGSGKSSLVKELTPLPPDRNHYQINGSKVIEISNRGSLYVIKYTFDPKTKCSFIKDDVELNAGGTITVQVELCRQEFGVTPKSHLLSTGQVSFCNMKPAARREWFTMLSDVSYDYAMFIFNRLKTQLRDVAGSLNRDRKRLVEEQANMVTPEEEELLISEATALEREIEFLQSQRAPVTRSSTLIMEELSGIERDVVEIANQLLSNRKTIYGSVQYESMDCIDGEIEVLKNKITSLNAVLNEHAAVHKRLSDDLDILSSTSDRDVDGLRSDIAELTSKRNQLKLNNKVGIVYDNPSDSLAALTAVYDALMAVVIVLPNNSDGNFSSAKYAAIKDVVVGMKQELFDAHRAVAVVQTKLSHIDSHRKSSDVTCPKCRHIWQPGFTEDQYQQTGSELAVLEAKVTDLKSELVHHELYLHDFEMYLNQYREYTGLVRGATTLRVLWAYIEEQEYLTHSPMAILSTLDDTFTDLRIQCGVAQLDSRISELTTLMTKASELGTTNFNSVSDELAALEIKTDRLYQDLNQTKNDLSNYQSLRLRLASLQHLTEKAQAGLDKMEKLSTDAIEMIRRETVQQCLQTLQVSLARKSDAVANIKIHRAVLNDLERNIERSTREEQAYKLVVQELSPTEGLIADGLMGFINNYVAQMNAVIRTIWVYPLEVIGCALSDENSVELDYEFPLMVDTPDNIVPDISMCSTGQAEIIDLAFQIVAIASLGLAETPLMLDEFGGHLDAGHQAATSMAIKNLMDTQPFTQLFMISHYESGYGSFTNADICVLDSRNISLPAHFNKHVTML